MKIVLIYQFVMLDFQTKVANMKSMMSFSVS